MSTAEPDKAEEISPGREAHEPVLLARVLDALAVRPDGRYVDCTYGRGGHAAPLRAELDEGRLIVADRDPEAVAHARDRFADDPRVTVWRARLSGVPERLREEGWAGRVNGILADLGVSSPQLETPERGFGFRQEGPLDMRMEPDTGESALELLRRVDRRELTRILREFGEEREARRIAHALVAAREADALPETTRDLAGLVEAEVKAREPSRHPATRTFQALRIAVNRELEELERFLAEVIDLLAPGGRLVVIAFHSLEDRRVKRALRDASRVGDLPPSVPVAPEGLRPRLRLVGRAQHADEDEVRRNPRARSAVLRVAERL